MKKLWKQVVTVVLVTVTAATALAGCGQSTSNQNAGTGTSAAASENANIAFSWWGNDDRHKATQEAIKLFEEKNPGIKVEGQPSGFGSLDEQFATRYVGGTEADVMTLQYSWVAQYSPTGEGFYDLANVADLVDLSQFDEEFLKFGQIDGKQQAVPLGKNVLCFMVNKSAYERVGWKCRLHGTSTGKQQKHFQKERTFWYHPPSVLQQLIICSR